MKVRKMKRLRILILALCVCLIAGVAETLNMVDAYGEGEEGTTVTAHLYVFFPALAFTIAFPTEEAITDPVVGLTCTNLLPELNLTLPL